MVVIFITKVLCIHQLIFIHKTSFHKNEQLYYKNVKINSCHLINRSGQANKQKTTKIITKYIV